MYGVIQIIPSQAEKQDTDLDRLPEGLHKYDRGDISGFIVTEIVELSD